MDISAVATTITVGARLTPQTYLCKFGSDGRRGETHPVSQSMTDAEKQEYLNRGFIEITAEDWEIYVNERGKNGTGMIRGKDGKPTDAPPYVPTKEEKIAALDYQYTTDKEQLMKDYSDALLHDDTETAAQIKEDMAALDEKYDEDYRKIEEE